MEIIFRFFDGLNEQGYSSSADNRLRKLNNALLVEYEFFQSSAGKAIHCSKDVTGWMSVAPTDDEIVVALLHFSNFEDVAEKAVQWDDNRKNRLFVLLFTGGNTSQKMRKAATILQRNCGVLRAYELKKPFPYLLQNNAWGNLHGTLRSKTNIGDIKQTFDSFIRAINNTDVMEVNSEASAEEAIAQNEKPENTSLEILPVHLGFALEILLQSAPLAEGNARLEKKLVDRKWWKRGLSWVGENDLIKVWDTSKDHYPENFSANQVKDFLKKVFSNEEEKLLEAAKEAHKKFEEVRVERET